MILRLIKKVYLPIVCFVFVSLAFTFASTHCYSQWETLDMAQNFINLRGEGNIVLHTNIPYGSVLSVEELKLNNASIDDLRCVQDSLGYLDIHFSF